MSPGDHKDVLSEEKYGSLAERFVQHDFSVETVLYNHAGIESLAPQLNHLDALLVWVNPIEQGQDRTLLDRLLDDLQSSGVLVSALPEAIAKIGTKKVLFDTRNLEFGSDVAMYSTFDEFRTDFLQTLKDRTPRVLKQFRGSGGDGIYKVWKENNSSDKISFLHARRGSEPVVKTTSDFYEEFRSYFARGAPMLSQEWNGNIKNGMIRCYMTGIRVVGFGYQEINGLFPSPGEPIPPGKRHYFTEGWPFFSDLRESMEESWIQQLLDAVGLASGSLPVIWDADFFINSVPPEEGHRYTLCEINVSCVSPFPESAIPGIVEEGIDRLANK